MGEAAKKNFLTRTGTSAAAPVDLWHWFASIDLARETPVKSNPVRKVYLLDGIGGKRFYLKHDCCGGAFDRLKSLFRNKAREEFAAAQLLERCGVPVVKYLGWGRNGAEGFLISEEFGDAVGAKEYWFSGTADFEEKKVFLDNLERFVLQLIESRLYHPDFHLGNILVEKHSGRIVLVDPYGIGQRKRKLNVCERTAMCKVFIEFRGEFSPEKMSEILIAAGLAANDGEAAAMWRNAIRAEEDEVRRGWEKRRRQILSGKSKFCRRIDREEIIFYLRNTVFYQPLYESERFAVPGHLEARYYTGDEAGEIWLKSFFAQLMREPLERVPLIWERHPDGNDVIYFATTKEEKNACGF